MLNNFMKELLGDVTLLNNLLLIGFFIGFALVFFIAHRDPNNKLVWTDMLLDSKTGKLSLAKFGNFFGIAISSWIMIYFVQVKEAYSMYPMLFGAWLAFLGGVYTFNNYLKSKDAAKEKEKKSEE